MRALTIFGLSSYAEIACLYFERDTDFVVQKFVVDDKYKDRDEFLGRPVVPLGQIQATEETQYFHAAVTYTGMNRLRERIFTDFLQRNYRPASYVSPYAYVDPTVTLGEHVFIFEDNTIQPRVGIGTGTILWSGNHIGHHSTVDEFTFISSHVVLSGHCQVGRNSFLGVNCSVGNGVTIGAANWIFPGTSIVADTGPNEAWRPERPVMAKFRPLDRFAL